MKALAIEDLVESVRIAIDEISLNDSDFQSGQDEQELDTIIESKIVEGIRFVHSNADASLIEPEEALTGTVTSDDITAGKVVVTVSSDLFMRLCYGSISSWVRPVYEPIYWPDKEYARLSNSLATGTWERPEIGIRPNAWADTDTSRVYTVIEMYAPKAVGDTYVLTYLQFPEYSSTATSVDICEKLEAALIYYIGGLTLMTLHDPHAEDLLAQAYAEMGRKDALKETT